MTLEELIDRAQDMFGFDLDSPSLIGLFNDARQDAARLSEFPRKVISGTHTEGVLELPEDFLLGYALHVNGKPWAQADRETVRRLENGELVPTGPGYWYQYTDDEGKEVIQAYPDPGVSAKVEFEYVYCGLDWEAGSMEAQPSEFPRWFHPKLIYFVADIYYSTVEDNPELGETQKARAEQAVSDLIRWGNEQEAGDGVFVVPIQGMTT